MLPSKVTAVATLSKIFIMETLLLNALKFPNQLHQSQSEVRILCTLIVKLLDNFIGFSISASQGNTVTLGPFVSNPSVKAVWNKCDNPSCSTKRLISGEVLK